MGYASTAAHWVASDTDLIALADVALYRAKCRGRNQSVEGLAT